LDALDWLRKHSRNGYRHRDFDTRAGTIDLAIPKLREGSDYPGWLLEPRRRAERTLTYRHPATPGGSFAPVMKL